MLLLGETLRWDRLGEKAVRRRRREVLEVRSGVKDWKRFVRVESGEGILGLVCCWDGKRWWCGWFC